MAKTLALSVTQRMNARAIIEGREPRTAGEARLYNKIIDLLDLTPEEKVTANYRTIEAGIPGSTQNIDIWDNGPEHDFAAEIKFEDAQYDKLREVFNGFIPNLKTGNPAVRAWHQPLLDALGL